MFLHIFAQVTSDNPATALHGGEMNSMTSLVTALPNQGMLGPYEKIPIFFRFSPRWNEAQQGKAQTLLTTSFGGY